MTVTRQRAKGRRGGEGERFAYIPESVLRSAAVCSLPHAAFKILAVLLLGRSKERNGTACCSCSYAEQFGIVSRDTVRRSLEELQERGLIVITRRVSPFKKHPTLYGVTWWPIYFRDGEPLASPEPATHAYLNWRPIAPMVGAESDPDPDFRSHRSSNTLAPMVGAEKGNHRTDGDVVTPKHRTDGRCKSLDLGSGTLRAQVEHLIREQPHLTDRDVARPFEKFGVTETVVGRVREAMQHRERGVA